MNEYQEHQSNSACILKEANTWEKDAPAAQQNNFNPSFNWKSFMLKVTKLITFTF